jgi:protein SCO1/2
MRSTRNSMEGPVMKMQARSVVGILAALWLSSSAALAHDGDKHVVAWPGGSAYERSVRAYTIPDVVLVDADARPVRLRELLASDDPVMMNFVFTTCSTICPIMVKVFADVPSRLGPAARNLRMISISIDPENDTPAQLKSYAKNFGADLKWHFLTGRVEDINTVQRAFGTYSGDKMSHEPLTLMREGRGRSWVRIDGFANPDQLASEYRKLVVK